MSKATAKEWAEFQELLPEVVERFGEDLTVGEAIHIAARICGSVNAWDPGPGGVVKGLEIMLALPPGGEWGCGRDGPTYAQAGGECQGCGHPVTVKRTRWLQDFSECWRWCQECGHGPLKNLTQAPESCTVPKPAERDPRIESPTE